MIASVGIASGNVQCQCTNIKLNFCMYHSYFVHYTLPVRNMWQGLFWRCHQHILRNTWIAKEMKKERGNEISLSSCTGWTQPCTSYCFLDKTRVLFRLLKKSMRLTREPVPVFLFRKMFEPYRFYGCKSYLSLSINIKGQHNIVIFRRVSCRTCWNIDLTFAIDDDFRQYEIM